MKNKDLYKLGSSIANSYVQEFTYPYEVLPNIKDIILEIGKHLDDKYIKKDEDIWISKTAKVMDSAFIQGPCIIDHEAEIRPNAYIRGNAIIGKACVFGNSCEIKNAILYDYATVPHFNYVGDSILGNYAHMGAGSITSNVKSDKTIVSIKNGEKIISTNRKKVGAFLGDYVEVGCNCVLTPGSIVGRHSNIYPLVMLRGVVGDNKIVKSQNEIVEKENL